MSMSSISIYVVASSMDKQLSSIEKSNIRNYFFVDQPHKGDNIDNLNQWLCELTALYYMWKNQTSDIVGLEHYRRFFVENSKTYDISAYTPINENRITSLLDTYDAIVAYHQHPINRRADSYLKNEQKYGLFTEWLGMVDESLAGFKDFTINLWSTSSLFICCNMFIAKRKLITEYCEWLFPMITKYAEHFGRYTEQYNRLIGYLAEFTWGAWLMFHNKSIYLHNHIRFSKDMTHLEDIERTTVHRGLPISR